MAESYAKTTSSTSLVENEMTTKTASPTVPLPKQGEALLMIRLADNLAESYQLVKQRQQQYNELSARNSNNNKDNNNNNNNNNSSKHRVANTHDWEDVTNKLKRKKKLSASLTSVSDTVNQEKRTRIEGIQLNCRGKLPQTHREAKSSTNAEAGQSSKSTTTSHKHATNAQSAAAKPPLPPVIMTSSCREGVSQVPPPRLKRALQENMQTIQKLNALTDQLRLEINELKSSLTTERGAVRVLRAQNESETRKWKNEVKKMQHAMDILKKSTPCQSSINGRRSQDQLSATDNAENLPNAAGTSSAASNEIQRLTNEIIALKVASKASDEKKSIDCDAERRKAADIRELRDSYEIRLTQLTKSAKTEISRLLEEIKTKERSIGQLRRELQQNKQSETNKSRNATKKPNATTNKTNKKINKRTETETKQETTNANAKKNKTKNDAKDMKIAQNSNEMKQLRDLELINNARNQLQNNNKNINEVHKTTKIFKNHTTNNSQNKLKTQQEELTTITTTSNNSNTNEKQEQEQDECKMLNETKTSYACLILEKHDRNNNNQNKNDNNNCNDFDDANNNNYNKNTTTVTNNGIHDMLQGKETEELQTHADLLTERLMEASNEAGHQVYGSRMRKDNNSETDSALSSAPPSISPQPPANGMETADIWQTLREYSSDVEKFRKELAALEQENKQLRQELASAKEQLEESESKMARKFSNNNKMYELMERIKYLEQQEHQLETEANELREQNELLEFRILELEDNNDKWSIQGNNHNNSNNSNNDVWNRGFAQPHREDPMAELFGNKNDNYYKESSRGIHAEESVPGLCDMNSMDPISYEELQQRLSSMVNRLSFDDEETKCLRQIQSILQNLDAISNRSGPDSLTNSSSDEPSSLDAAKSRISDYSSASSASSTRIAAATKATHAQLQPKSAATFSAAGASGTAANKAVASHTANSRIVATVLPYNSAESYQNAPPTNTPTDTPRKQRHAWQSNSLSESGVFVESDFLSDASEPNPSESQQAGLAQLEHSERSDLTRLRQSPVTTLSLPPSTPPHKPSTQTPAHYDNKRLQYYKDRSEVLERKVLIYESSGDLQTKRLADRLQREIALEQQLKELYDRVELLESENALLEEEKCEFEEAENDTRLRLQRLEVELEILSQRNVELEMSREALSAKYKDCRTECLNLRDDLAASETQIRHIEEDKQKTKETLEFLHSTLPLFMVYGSLNAGTLKPQQEYNLEGGCSKKAQAEMGNIALRMEGGNTPENNTYGYTDDANMCHQLKNCSATPTTCTGRSESPAAKQLRELEILRAEVKSLQYQIKELNARHYDAMESADTHWVELEKEYKCREDVLRNKESSLKNKIQKLQDCMREDARAAQEKIAQLEEQEKELRCALLRMSKEHREALSGQQDNNTENDGLKAQLERLRASVEQLKEQLELEKKSCKSLNEELNYARKAHAETESRTSKEMDALCAELRCLKKQFLHVEVTNSELREEVCTLEKQVKELERCERDCADKIRCLSDEISTKDELLDKLEKRLQRETGKSLADELGGSPSKRFKREDIIDLQTASIGLGAALMNAKDCDKVPSHKKLGIVAREVKKLADTLLACDKEQDSEEVSIRLLKQRIENKLDCMTLQTQQQLQQEDCDPCKQGMMIFMINEDGEQILLTGQNMKQDESKVEKLETVKKEGEIEEGVMYAEMMMVEAAEIKHEIEAAAEVDVTVGMALMPDFDIDANKLLRENELALSEVSLMLKNMKKTSKKDAVKVEAVSKKNLKRKLKKKQKRAKLEAAVKRLMESRCKKQTSDNAAAEAGKLAEEKLEISKNEQEIKEELKNKDVQNEELKNVMLENTESNESVENTLSKEEALKNAESTTISFKTTKTEQSMHSNSAENVVSKSSTKYEHLKLEPGQMMECASQVSPQWYSQCLLNTLPLSVQEFVKALHASQPNIELGTAYFNEMLKKQYEMEPTFGLGVQMLKRFINERGLVCKITKADDFLKNYEEFACAMSCLHALEEIYKPHKIPLLAEIEMQINEQLLKFHAQKVESELYCTVYYPVDRQK